MEERNELRDLIFFSWAFVKPFFYAVMLYAVVAVAYAGGDADSLSVYRKLGVYPVWGGSDGMVGYIFYSLLV